MRKTAVKVEFEAEKPQNITLCIIFSAGIVQNSVEKVKNQKFFIT